MKGNEVFRWSERGKRASSQIKSAIADAPTLMYLDFNKDFNVYCYASDSTLSAILTQNHDDNVEVPIAFMSIPLKERELKYSIVKKQAFAVVKAVKQFRFYILNSHSNIYVPDTIVKTILTQQEIGLSKRASWIAKVREYDIDIKPTKLVRGCVDKEQREKLLKFFQNEACGGHFSSSVTTYKMLRNCYYWPGMFRNADEWVKKCDTCQQFKGKVVPVKQTTSEVVCDFIKQNLLVRYGVPHKIVTDNAINFSSHEISAFCYKYGIILSHASDYYPQGNGQAEASNKNIITILRKLVDENERTWHKHLYEALWVDRTTKKRAIGLSPFEIDYGTEAKLSIPLELSFLKLQEVLDNYEFKDAL
ncbi:uncharacterized protein LOC131874037 [Cryptomeria japonica]|uniref:uncharacterized protein LOC131874037 n=1 Tax=Cryptomeria japonica TaxID=3369 RepID=UPI0027DA6C5B|nr:uncharacterized protein LOC131874037 [Cryptomeria japonica]